MSGRWSRDIWNHVRRAVDLQRGKGRYILTGSAAPTDDLLRHSGTGRMTRLRMRTLSLFRAGMCHGRRSSVGDLLAGGRASAAGAGADRVQSC